MNSAFTFLCDTPELLLRQLNTFIPKLDYFQIDVQDGIFVPSKTVSLQEFGNVFQQLNSSLQSLARQKTFDVHLMLKEYDMRAVYELRKLVPVRWSLVHTNYRGEISADTCPVFDTENPIDDPRYKDWIEQSPAVQIMTVHPGPQGQPFLPEQLDKVAHLHRHFPGKTVIIDGAVNDESLGRITSLPSIYHPDLLGIGSYLARAQEPELERRLQRLRELRQK